MSKKKINDGLNKWQRYRLKDLEGYRKLKREYAQSPEQRDKRAAYQRKYRAKPENKKKHNEQHAKSYHRNKHRHINMNTSEKDMVLHLSIK